MFDNNLLYPIIHNLQYKFIVLGLALPSLNCRSYISFIQAQKNPLREQGDETTSLRSHIASGESLIQFP